MTNEITLPFATSTEGGIYPAGDKRLVDSVVPSATNTGRQLLSISLTVINNVVSNPAAGSIRDFTQEVGGLESMLLHLTSEDAVLLTNTPATFVTLTKGDAEVAFGITDVASFSLPSLQAVEVGIEGRRIAAPNAPAVSSDFNTGTLSARFFRSVAISLAVPHVHTGSALDVLAINSDADGIEWAAPSGGNGGNGSSTLVGLTDTPSSFGTEEQVLAVNSGTDAVEWVDQTDTHPDISFLGLTGTIPIYDEVAPSVPEISVWRNNVKLNPILSGTPTASQYLYTATNTTGLTATTTINQVGKAVDIDSVSLSHTHIVNGGAAYVEFEFTLLGDDGNTFQLRRDIGFQRVDTDTFGTDDQDADEVDTDATQFSGNLSPTDTDVQTALETVDGLSLVPTGGDENRVVGYDSTGSFDVGRLVGTDILYWPDRDADIAEGTIAVNSGGRVFVARQDIETDDDDYDTDPDTNESGVRARWEATHLQNTHAYLDGNEFVVVFGERNNLNAIEIEMGISLDVNSNFSRLMHIIGENRMFFAIPSDANPSDLENDRIQPGDSDTYTNVQDLVVIGGNHTNGYTFRLGDDLVRFESLQSSLQGRITDLEDDKLDLADTSIPLSHTHTFSFRDRSGSNYDFTAVDQVYFNLTEDTDGYLNVILSQLKTGAQPNWHDRLVDGSRLLLISSAAGTENLYIVKDPHSTIQDAADDYYARIFRCKLLRGSITAQPAQGGTMHVRTDLSVDLDLSEVSTRRIPVKTTPVDDDHLLVVDSADNDVIKRVGWDDLPSGGGGVSTPPRSVRSPVANFGALSSTNTSIAFDLTDFTGYVTDDTWDDFDSLTVSSAHGNSPNYSTQFDIDIGAELSATDDVVSVRPHSGVNENFTVTRTSDTVMTLDRDGASVDVRIGYLACQFFGTPGTAGTDGTDGTDGTGIPDSSGASDGDVVTWDDSSSAAVWEAPSGGSGTTNLAIANRETDSLEVTSSTGTGAEIESATASLAGLMSAVDKTKLNGIETSAKDDQDADEVDTDATQFSGNLSPADTDVQAALETIDGLTLGGGGGGDTSVVAYSATGGVRTSFFNSSFENITIITDAITRYNQGGFTVTRVDGDDRIVIPEDGTYIIQYSYYFDVDNDTNNDRRYVPVGRLVYDDGTTDPIQLCQPQTAYARGAYSSEVSLASLNLYATAQLSEDDEVYGQIRTWRQHPSNTTSVQHTINITKVGGAAGVNVQADWDASSGDALILNKPTTISTAQATKLAGIEAGATADQTGAEIKTAYETNSDTNAFTDADETKLDGIETGATADQTDAEIKTAYETNSDTNAFTDADETKLDGIEAGADVNVGTDLTTLPASALVAILSSTGSNTALSQATPTLAGVMTATDKGKLDGIETDATADQTAAEVSAVISGFGQHLTDESNVQDAIDTLSSLRIISGSEIRHSRDSALAVTLLSGPTDSFAIRDDDPPNTGGTVLTEVGDDTTRLYFLTSAAVGDAVTGTGLVHIEKDNGGLNWDDGSYLFEVSQVSITSVNLDIQRLVLLTGALHPHSVAQSGDFTLGRVEDANHDDRVRFTFYSTDHLTQSVPYDLGDAAQVLAVNAGEDGVEWADLPTISAVAFASSMTQLPAWFNASWENVFTGLITTGLNYGGFTLETVSGDQRIVIPEDGTYSIHISYAGDTNAIADNQRAELRARMRLDRSGTVTTLGNTTTSYSRGNRGGQSWDRVSSTLTALVALQEDDEIFGEVSALRENASTTMALDATINIDKVGGPTGATGAAGTGVATPLGTTGQHLVVDSAGTGTEWTSLPSAVMFESSPSTITHSGDTPWTNSLSSLLSAATINQGSWTVDANSNANRIRIPEDGTYVVSISCAGSANNENDSNADMVMRTRMRAIRGSGVDAIGEDATCFIKGQHGTDFDKGSTHISSIARFDADDQVWFDLSTTMRNNDSLISYKITVYLYKIPNSPGR